MTTIDGVEAASDADLLALARSGRSDALAELWRRHYGNAVRSARRWTSNAHDAEDAASEAFSRMLAAVGDGRGPTGSVGGYLSVSVRNVVANRVRRHEHSDLRTPNPELYARLQAMDADPVADRAEHALVREAFAALPIRWRMVLWRTAVDRDTNGTLGQEMGLTANAVAALAVRARAGFRAAYLQVHVSRGSVDPGCQPFLVLLPALVSGGTVSTALSDHVRGCARCRERAGELSEIERHLRVMTLPVVLGVTWAKLTSLVPAGVTGVRQFVVARQRGLLLAGAGGLAAAAIMAGGGADPDPAPGQERTALGPTATVRVPVGVRTPTAEPTASTPTPPSSEPTVSTPTPRSSVAAVVGPAPAVTVLREPDAPPAAAEPQPKSEFEPDSDHDQELEHDRAYDHQPAGLDVDDQGVTGPALMLKANQSVRPTPEGAPTVCPTDPRPQHLQQRQGHQGQQHQRQSASASSSTRHRR